jgi:hypothetical protein
MKSETIANQIEIMKNRVSSLEVAIMKMEQSGKFDPEDPRFDSLQDQIAEMYNLITKLGIMIGKEPYKVIPDNQGDNK